MEYQPLLRSISCFFLVLYSFLGHAQTLQLGSGTSITGTQEASPVNIYYRSMHMQIVYRAAELNAAGVFSGKLTELGFYIENAPIHNLPDFTISVGHTSANDASSHIAAPLKQVYKRSAYSPLAGGFDMLSLDSVFDWNGTDNIVVDVCFDRVFDYTSTGRVRYYNDGSNNAGFTRSDGSDQCGIPVSSTTNNKPQVQMTFLPDVANNAGVVSTNITDITCAGSSAVKATVGNFGNNQIDSLMIGWEVNGVAQNPVKYTSMLDTLLGSGSHTAEVSLGNYNFISGVAYNLTVYTYQPNGLADAQTSNDSVEVSTTVGLGGNYTIGGVGADYGSFTAAVNDLIAKGICGTTTFQVAAGTYFEQISLPQIEGAGPGSEIIFESVALDSSTVTLSNNSATFSSNYTLRFNGAGYVSFRHMGIASNNATYDRVVYFEGGSNHITFHNSVIKNVDVASPYNYQLVEVNSAAECDYLEFSHSYFLNGYSGIYNNGSDADHFTITHNQFINQRYDGVYLYGANFVTIDDNLINTNSTSSFIAIELRYCDSTLSVQRNHIMNVEGGQGINLDYCDATAAQPARVANNFIHLNSASSSAEGIYILGSLNVNVVFNTVNLVSTNTNNIGLHLSGGGAIHLLNNNIAVKGGDALYVHSGLSIDQSDFNNFYNANGDVGYWEDEVKTLSDLIAASGKDSNSISEPPYFYNDTSYQSAQVALNNNGSPVSGITTDIEGETRDASNPDIGADEFSPTSQDAGVYALVVPEMPFAAGSLPVKAVIRNFGGVTLTSATINWSVNGVAQSAVNYNGSLNTGDTAWVLLGNVNFAETTVYNLEAYTSMPNGGADALAVNDTAFVGPITPALAGTYTIGGTTPDFTSFTAAADILNLGGIRDHVFFDVRSGTYSERLEFTRFPTLNVSDTVTFRSEAMDSAAVTLNAGYTNSSENYVIRINGSQRMSFEHLTIENTSANSYSRVLYLDSSAAYITLDNCALISGSTSSSLTSVVYVYNSSNMAEPHHISINASTLLNGYYGLYTSGRSGRSSHLNVTNSNILGGYNFGLYLSAQDSITVRNNLIIPRSGASASYQGLYVYYSTGGSIIKNRIYAVNANDGMYGFSLQGHPSDPYLIANNFISTGGNNSGGYTMELQSLDYVKVVHNNLLTTNTDPDGAAFNDDYSYYNGSNGVEVLNNVFQNEGGGYAVKVDHSNTTTSFNYNNLYTTGSKLARWSTTDAADLADWQSVSSQAANSVSADAQFLNDTNLHVNASILNKAATPLAYVSDDIDGESRDASTPDIGADEFEPLGDDAGLLAIQGPQIPFEPGNQNVYVELLNNGADTLTAVTINWEVNGVAQTAYNYSGNLPTGQSQDSVNIGTYNFLTDTVYTIKAYTSLPNGNADVLATNDTIEQDGLITALSGLYTLGGANPDFADFTAANTALSERGVSGWVTFSVRDGEYNETLLMRPVRGASATDSILFVSESNNPELVKLRTNTYSPVQLELRGANHFSFKDITFRSDYIYTGLGLVLLDSNASHINFMNCVFSDTIFGTNGEVLLASEYGSRSDSLSVMNCTFKGGRYGINAYGGVSGTVTGLRVINSNFVDQYYRGIYFEDQSDFTVSGDSVYTNRGNTSYTGIYGYFSREGGRVSGNYILATDDGIYLSDVDGTNGDEVLLTNNYVGLSGSNSGSGIYASSCDYLNVAYNSVRSFNSSTSTEAFYESSCSNMKVYNNIFQNEGQGYAIDMDGYSSYEQDHNNLYSSGATLARYRNSAYSDLSAFQAVSNLDTNGVSQLAQFSDTNDVHVESVGLNAAGTPLPYVNTDFDGDTRDPSRPDIGADEFTVNTDDAALTALTGPVIPFASGNNTVYVSMLNNGLDTLKTAQITWKVNGVAQTTYNWVGSLATGAQDDSVAIGTYNFSPGTSHNIVAWVSLPNGNPDILNANDTAGAPDLYPALSGYYSLGGGSADFPTFVSAVDALHAGGVLSWVTFRVNNGTYTEQITLHEVAGASPTDSIVFQSLSGDSSLVKLTFNGNSTNRTTVKLNGADYFSFKDMTLEGQSSTYALLAELSNDTRGIQFLNCVFNMPATTNFNVQGVSGIGDIEDLHIRNSLFVNGNAGIYIDATNSTGLKIIDNRFSEQYRYGVYAYDFVAPQISRNYIEVTNSNSSYNGFYLVNFSDGFRINANQVLIDKMGVGYYLYNMDGAAQDRGVVANNFASIGAQYNGTNSMDAFYILYSGYTDVVYNSANHLSSNGRAFYMVNNTNSLQFKNNIAMAGGGGYAYYSVNSTAISDYNNFISNGTYTFYNFSGGGDLADLAAWQAATGMDAHSVSVDPLFVSDKDLHITQSALDSTGTPITLVTTDIDGENRNASKPDIGADEVNYFPGDVSPITVLSPTSGCLLGANEQFTVRVANTGSQAQGNFDVSLVVNSDTLTETITSNIDGGNTLDFTFSTGVDLSAVGSYAIEVYTSLPSDNNLANDTIKNTIINNPAPAISITNDTAICEGSAITLTASGGNSYNWSNGLSGSSITVGPTVTTTYVVTIDNGNNCITQDSVTVSVNNITDTVEVNLTTCDPGQAGSSTQAFTNQYGCDSVVTTIVNLLPTSDSTLIPVTICEGETASIFGSLRSMAGSYYDTLTAVNGCDSILTQDLVVLPVDSIMLSAVTICQGESANIFDTLRTSAGTYYATYTAQTGCDSITAIELVVNPVDTFRLGSPEICQGDSALLFGAYRQTAGAYYNVLQAVTGCDSVVYYDLVVNPVYNHNVSLDICKGQSVILEGAPRSTSGVYTDLLTSISGCDSTVVTTLTVYPVDTSSSAQTVAIGDSVMVGGSYQTTSGVYTDVFTSINNCDSVHITTLDFVPPQRYFTFTGNANYSSSLVYPETGDEYTTFNFEVTYYDTTGALPPYGFPRTILDYEGNGQYNNAKDRTIVMSQADPTDQDPRDGKVYLASINSLEVGMNYHILTQVVENNKEVIFGPFDNLDVLAQPDLEIFANNITFSNPNPPVSSPLTVSATITNTSDYTAQNFVVHLVNQYDTTLVYPDITVPSLSPRSSTTVSWNITTPAVDAWCPMEVTVDYTNVIAESNELDNVARRPFINGDYNLPGAIVVYPTASPSSRCSTPGSYTRISGYAYYTQTAVPLQDSSVAGATVTMNRGGATYTGLTNSRGYFSISIPAPVIPGTYSTNVEVTDFTLTGDSTTTFDILSCPCTTPDLAAYLSLSDYSIIVGQSIDGTATIRNIGCDTAIAHIMSFTQTGGVPVLMDQNMPQMGPGESTSYSFNNITFNSPGTYTICVIADDARTVGETNFSNNRYCRTIRVYPALPDIVPTNGPYTSQYLCNASGAGFRVSNRGAVATGAFDCDIYVSFNGTPIDTLHHSIANINAFSSVSFNKAFTYTAAGVYTFNIHCDTTVATGGVVTETDETNNTATYSRTILECKPDLTISGCGNVQVDPFSPTAPGGAVVFEATVRNTGNAVATGPMDVDFVVSTGATYTVTIGDIQPGQSLLVQTNAVATASGAAQLTVTADARNTVTNEFNENNNSQTDNLCWEFQPVPRCGGADFWNRTYNVNETAFLAVAVDVDHLYKADSLEVQFEVSGPGIAGTQNLGNALLTQVQKTCACPRLAVLPTNFVFNQVGTYTFTMTVDPDNAYPECDETDNVLVRQVTVNNRPDMRILSQFINPSVINPDLNDTVDFVISYENIGKSNINDLMELKVLIDGMPFDSIKPVVGLVNGDNTSYSLNERWSSNIPGVHVIRAIIDSDNEIPENDELNNEATRAVVVGEAANLMWVNFKSSDIAPALGDTIQVFGYVKNNGDLATEADATISYVNNVLDTINISTVPLGNINPGDSVLVNVDWPVVDNQTTLVGEIVNSTQLEFTYNDNVDSTQIGKFNLSFTTTAACYGDTGSAKVTVSGNGIAPYTYQWSNGAGTDSIAARPGIYTVNVTDASGFTVTGTATINVLSGGIYTTADAEVCAGDSALIFGTYRNTAGYYYDTLQSSGGCDSIIRQALSVNPGKQYVFSPLNLCGVDSALIFGEYHHQSGLYYDTLMAASGCDSVLSRQLTLNPVYEITLPDAVGCDSAQAFGNYVYTSGIYRDTLQATTGCDSILVVNVSILEGDTVNVSETACDSYTWPVNGITYDDGGIYYANLTNGDGCDSIVILDLTVNYSDTVADTITACDSYTWPANGVTYMTSGNYSATLTNVTGCDSVINLALTINNSSDTNAVSLTACDSYRWADAGYDTSFTASGTYFKTLTNAVGCDSVLRLDLTINHSDTVNISDTACDSYFWAATGLTYDDRGIYTATLTNVAGCDSIVILDLMIHYSDTVADTITACDSYTWPVNGMTYTSSGDYSTTLSTVNGCDSVLNLALTINNSSDTNAVSLTACDSYRWADAGYDTSFTASGTYFKTLTNAVGCDSVLRLDLTINSSDTVNITDTACDSYFWAATGLTYDDRGIYTATLTNVAGCDSVVILDLMINSSDTINDTITTCDSYTWPVNGMTYTSSGDYSTTLTNAVGCDSVLNLALTINNSSDTNAVSLTACDSYRWADAGYDTSFTASGTYFKTLTNSAGCDSVLRLDLTINTSDTVNTAATACDTYFWPVNGNTLNDGGIYQVTLTTISGCDSVVILDLTLNHSDTIKDTITACDSYTWPVTGMTYTSSGNYSTTLTNTAGCDSVLNLALTINHSDSTGTSVTACDSYDWYVGNATSPITYTSSGVYTVTLTNSNGCDSLVSLDLTINNSDTVNTSATACDSYFWPANGTTLNDGGIYQVTLTNSVGCDSVVILDLTLNLSDTINDTITACDSYTWAVNSMTYTSSGNYSHTLTNASGCDSVINLNLTINNSFHDVDSVNGCEGYLWSFNSQLYTQSGTYYDTLTTVNGCDSSMTLHLTLDSINTSVSQSGATLTALNTSSTATFQWLDCDNSFTPITGADSSSFTPAVNGNYAVLILDNGCADTSACYEVNNVGLEGGFALSSISVFPNPTTGDYQVDFGRAYNKVRITVTDLAGKVLEKHHLENSQSFNSTLDGPKGMYMIWIQTEYRKQQVFRIVKD